MGPVPSPDQIRVFIEQTKGQLAAIEEVTGIKENILAHLDSMEDDIANAHLTTALSRWVDIQRLEYTLVLKGLHEKTAQLKQLLAEAEKQLNSRIVSPGMALPRLS